MTDGWPERARTLYDLVGVLSTLSPVGDARVQTDPLEYVEVEIDGAGVPPLVLSEIADSGFWLTDVDRRLGAGRAGIQTVAIVHDVKEPPRGGM